MIIMKTKKGDFIEIDYIGKIKEENAIFDLTSEKIARENNIYRENHVYNPVTICLGKNDVIKGLDSFLVEKEINTEYEIIIEPENAFGKKHQDLIKLVPTTVFTKQNIQPFPGLQVNLNGLTATIRTISGGRTLVDFNHPLAGKTLLYKIKINKIISSTEEKVESILKQATNDFSMELKEKDLTISTTLDKKIGKKLEKEIKDRIPEISNITFKETKKNSIKN